jgi:hypothetical protein
MKLEDVLRKQGFSDADLQAAGTLLGDAKFRGAVETYVGGLESTLNEFRTENDKWADWAEKTNKPQLDALGQEKLNLTSQVGSLSARLQAVDPTFKPNGDGRAPERRQEDPNPNTFDPQKAGLLTVKDFDEKVNQYAAAQGTAIAMANDLAGEYRRLTGNDMLDYSTQDAEGRPLRGMVALLHEARIERKILPDYIAQKFDFAGKRAAAAENARKAAEEAVRKDERTKVIAEFGNPNTRPGMPSQASFVPPPRGDGQAAKMPWEIPATERRNARIGRAMETQAKSMVQ